METTTESLFATLGPEAREEALRLAARLQAHDGESVGLVAAARAAGIEDRFLREAVGRMATPPVSPVLTGVPDTPTVSDAGAAGLLLIGAIFALVHVSARFGGGFLAYALAFLLPFGLATIVPRGLRWLAPVLVVTTGVIAHLLMKMGGGWDGFTSYSYLLRTMGGETVLAILGALVAGRLRVSALSQSSPEDAKSTNR